MSPITPTDDPDTGAGPTVAGTARVVEVLDGTVWLEPEPARSCGGCLALAACGAKATATGARRFALDGDHGLRPGERVAVGIDGETVLRAAAVAYGLPLAAMIGGGLVAHLAGGGDGAAALATLAGLGAGVLAARILARRLVGQRTAAPRLLHRLPPDGAACPS